MSEELEYKPELKISLAYAKLFPNNCAVKEYTADGVYVGPCEYYLTNGTTCSRHGVVKQVKQEKQQ
jgi:hypothetical protein